MEIGPWFKTRALGLFQKTGEAGLEPAQPNSESEWLNHYTKEASIFILSINCNNIFFNILPISTLNTFVCILGVNTVVMAAGYNRYLWMSMIGLPSPERQQKC